MLKKLTYLIFLDIMLSLVVGPVKAGIVGWWKFDETRGTTAVDSSINGNNGATYGYPRWVIGLLDGALDLDGTDDYVDLPISSLLRSLRNCTLSTWVNWSGTGGAWQRIFDFGSGTNINMFLTPNTGGNLLRFAITISGYTNEDQTTSLTGMPIGWHHVAVVINLDNSTHTLYLDGEIVDQNTQARYSPSSLGVTTQNWLGRSQYPADGYYNGLLDDFRIYNTALSDAEIRAIAGTVEETKEIVGWWKLDEMSGNVAFDSSGNGNDGIIIGDPEWVTGWDGGALRFDGVDDSINCGNDAIFDLTDEVTLAAWVNANDMGSGQDNPWLGKGDTSYMIKNFRTGYDIEFFIYDGGWFSAHYTVDDSFNGEWHHVAGTYDGSVLQIYLDGIVGEDAFLDHVGNIDVTSYTVTIGTNSQVAGRFSDATLDDCRIYNWALSADEILAIVFENLRLAWNPRPPDGSVDVPLYQKLVWNPGFIMGYTDLLYNRHRIYIGTNFNMIDSATVPMATVIDVNEYEPSLDYGATYYWRVDEVDTQCPVKGNVWSFTTMAEPVEEMVEYQIIASEDDGYAFREGIQSLENPILRVGYSENVSPPYYISGMVFRNIDIPQGTEIISAHLRVRSYNNDLMDLVYGRIQAEDADDATGFDSSRKIDSLSRTNSSIEWDILEPWLQYTWYDSPDIAAVIQEVINRDGWMEGNSLVILFSARASEGGYRSFCSYDYNNDYAPQLEITHVIP